MALITDSVIFEPSSAPGSPVEGETYYDSTADMVKVWDGSNWLELSSRESATSVTTHATGGDQVRTYTAGGNDYKVHIFYTSGIFQTLGARNVDVLIVAGGGGAHSQIYNGGGGAGGLIYKTSELISTQSNAVTVGAGGAIEKRGGNSEFNSLVALGGGMCAGTATNSDSDGGSGGGSSHSSSGQGAGLQPTSIDGGFGNGGGDQVYGSPHYGTGGGGGAGGAGVAGTTGNGGAGGIGKPYTIRDGSTSVYYAGGGGGGRYNDLGTAAGGNGGGGNVGVAGTANSGGGGGATKAGGSGIVIIRYIV